jgi:hypothetical protein
MMDRSTVDRTAEFAQQLAEQMATLARSLGEWVQAEPRPLQEIETHVVRLLHELGNELLTALLPLAAPARPQPDLPCNCGQVAAYERQRSATLTTLLGRISFTRAIYACAHCGERLAPLEQQLQVAPGGLSLGLQELLALLGATQDSFAQATSVLERLCLVQVCPNSARAATEELGALLGEHAHDDVQRAKQTQQAPPARTPAPPRLYISMDGVLAHIHHAGWKELKTGCVYTTRTRRSQKQPEQLELRAEGQSYVAALADADSFGWQLWAEACRRGLSEQSEVVVLGDGAHWIWNLAADHFPQATQIVDWYHASQYIWRAAATVYGETNEQRVEWARQQLNVLWEGRVAELLVVLEPYRAKGEGVSEALSYFTSHQARMDYPTYRARGLQIGSGPVESACKQLVSARLKLAGMIWDAEGAEAVAVVRAWLKSERWAEAMRLRPPPRRTYRRQAALVAAA